MVEKTTVLTFLIAAGVFVGVFGALTTTNPIAIAGALTAIGCSVLTILLRMKDYGLRIPTEEAAE